jgi:hypothetical protein
VDENFCALDDIDFHGITPYCTEVRKAGPGELSLFEITMRVKNVQHELLHSCYRDGVKVYGIFEDGGGQLRRCFLHRDGTITADALRAYVEGIDGIYRKRKCIISKVLFPVILDRMNDNHCLPFRSPM